MKISKELLSEVLDIKIEDIIDFKIFMNELFYYQKLLIRANCQGKTSKHRDSIQQSINIYEFAFKCKEWGSRKGHTLSSTYYPHNNCICNIDITTKNFKQFEADTEIKVIIKACEWILKEIRR